MPEEKNKKILKKNKAVLSAKSIKRTTLKRAVLNSRLIADKKKSSPSNLIEKASLDIDNFLIDEQIYYASQVRQVLESEQEKIQPVLTELDRLILGAMPQAAGFKISRNHQGIKVSLNKTSRLTSLSRQSEAQPSFYTVNLRQPTAAFTAPVKERALGRDKFKRTKTTVLKNFSPSLLKRFSFKASLTDWWQKFFYQPRTIKPTAVLPNNSVIGFSPWWQRLKSSLVFALVALLFIVPLEGYKFYLQAAKTKGQVLGVAEEGLTLAEMGFSALQTADWAKASWHFSESVNYFIQAQQVLLGYQQTLAAFEALPVAGKKIKDSQNLLSAGRLLAQAAAELSSAGSSLTQAESLNKVLAENLALLQEPLKRASEDLSQAFVLLKSVDSHSLPVNYQNSLAKIQTQLPQFTESLDKLNKLFNFSLRVFGFSGPQRYLFIFQNENEIRPTGGFMGSYAEVIYHRGQLVKMAVPTGGFYDLKQDFQAANKKIISPAPLHLVGTPWMIWDVNWWLDFPTSMKKLLWFYEESGGPTMDGVLAFNTRFASELLKITGPIALEDYGGEVITAANLDLVLQHKTEFDYDKEANQPKKVIGELMQGLLNKLENVPADSIWPLMEVVNQSLAKKDIQLYFIDESLQQLAKQFNWAGEVKSAAKDYLAVVDTNIAGGKTNAYLKQEIKHYLNLQPNGSLIATVSIKRQHQGNLVEPTSAAYVFAKANNVSYQRVYVPLGSKFLGASGFNPPAPELFKEVYLGYVLDADLAAEQKHASLDSETGTVIGQESGKTVFGNWLQVKPGEEAILTFSYLLPFKFNLAKGGWSKFTLADLKGEATKEDYSLLVQGQPGVKNTVFTSEFKLPSGSRVDWAKAGAGGELIKNDQQITFTNNLQGDYFYGALISFNQRQK